MYRIIFILVAAFGAYGIATLIADYDGPFGVFNKFRSSAGRLFSCNVCFIPYLSVIPVLGLGLGFYEYLAVVGVAVILARSV